ncbi:hypothetical protein QYM36_006653 [Artemia franciscana]|uniref:DUF659 domain-containing protein n=1 Tax=Artemia franciscana TaxID=6661 RepID=A0AA88I489_ARTSF|nr:hypothetical protein QYM36_006653 [Artemia franciscana]
MGTPNFFGVTTVKQETEDGSSDGDKDVFGSKHPIFSVEHEANFCAISAGISKDCTANSNHLQQEFTTDGDKDVPIIGSYENDVSEEGCGIPCMPDLISTCLKQEMKVDCQDNELPSNIYVITENDMVKQEICRTGETSFENAAYEEALLLSSHLGDHQRNPSGGNPFDCVTCTSSSNLSEHHISHKEEKLFKCDIFDVNLEAGFVSVYLVTTEVDFGFKFQSALNNSSKSSLEKEEILQSCHNFLEVGFGCNNASVNMEEIKGLKALMKVVNPYVVVVDCVCHGLALCASSVFKEIPLEYDEFVHDVDFYIQHSPERTKPYPRVLGHHVYEKS